MASRYWVGGSGNWDTTTTHWATTSGGASGASAPTSSDDVFVDNNSGFGAGGTITMSGILNSAACNNFLATAGSAWVLTSSTDNLQVFGNLTLESLMTTTGSMRFTMSATSTGKTISTNGVTVDGGYDFVGVGGGWTCQDNLSTGSSISQSGGTFDANNFNITTPRFSTPVGSNSKVINMGNGTWTITGVASAAWNVGAANTTLNCGSSTLKFTNTSNTGLTTSINYGGFTYNLIWFDRGASTGSISAPATGAIVSELRDTGTTAHSLLFNANTSCTVTTFTVSGSPGNLITINSTTTSDFNLIKTGGGIVSCDYLNIQNSDALPSYTWFAGDNSIDNNTSSGGSGWIFTTPTQKFLSFM